jgi:hypothetical protein
MPNAKKETVEEINIAETDDKIHPDNSDGDSTFNTGDAVDGFTGFLNRIEARKVRVKYRKFPEDSN